MLHHIDTRQRFSGREDNYHKYRPDYPDKMIGFLYQELGLDDNAVIADIGSGTGKLTRHFIERGNKTYGVEINEAMREKAEELFADCKNFISIDGSSENTNLPDSSVDLITAAQAFHWFKPEESKKEFSRVLKPDGHIALIWNVRDNDSPLLKSYDQLLTRHFPEYKQTGHRNKEDMKIDAFFNNKKPQEKSFKYEQTFDYDGFIGRALSSSYTDPENKAFMQKLDALFEKHNSDGSVTFTYQTQLFFDQLNPS